MNSPICAFDCWTKTNKTHDWLRANNATLLREEYGCWFYEHPFKGDEAPILAVYKGHDPATVYNTQDFDLPVTDPTQPL